MNKKYKPVYAKKRFGQNFLVDPAVLDQIINSLHLQKQDQVLEIGPGRGALTQLLIQQLDHLHAIELDRDLCHILRNHYHSEKLTLYEADVLKFDLDTLFAANNHIRIVGNLPYNISTEVLFRLLAYRKNIVDMSFMLQKEVVERLAAIPGNKIYGKLSVLVQYYFDIAPLFQVAPESFKPVPKVYSAYVRLTPKTTMRYKAKSYTRLRQIVSTAFQQRRKTLKNALSSLFTENQLIEGKIDPGSRPENLTIEDYVRLSNLPV